jgi:antitoxin component YwqK of YwqJK toxin-antitoxin module
LKTVRKGIGTNFQETTIGLQEMSNQITLHMRFFAAIIVFVLGCDGGKKVVTEEKKADRRVFAADSLVEINGLYFEVGETIPFTGTAVWYYEGDQIMQETTMEGGKEHGIERWWHPNGNRAGQCYYSNGLLDGACVHWYPEDSKRELQLFYSNGKKDGIEITWYRNGKEKQLVRYVDGEKEGKAEGWFEDGTEAWKSNWKKDIQQGLSEEWHRNGSLKSRVQYNSDLPEGKETRWFENGALSSEVFWEDGVRHGTTTQWYPTGKKLKESNYKKGKLEGVTAGWFETGGKAFEQIFQGGELLELNEWDVNGTNVLTEKKKEFSGRKRIWAEGELEKSYPKQSEEFLTLAFGEPDDYEGGAMVYNNIVVKDRNCSVSFTLKFGLIESVEITPLD